MAAPKSIEEAIKRGMAEIQQAINEKTIPHNVRTFAELHEYVDANEFGGLCEDGYDLDPTPTEADATPDPVASNEIQEALDLWLKSGRKVDFYQLKRHLVIALKAIGLTEKTVEFVTHPDGDVTIDVRDYRLVYEPTDEGNQLDLYRVRQIPSHDRDVQPDIDEQQLTDFAEPFHYGSIAKYIASLVARDLISDALEADYMERLSRD